MMRCIVNYGNAKVKVFIYFFNLKIIKKYLLMDPSDFGLANDVFNHVKRGESWRGQLPVKNKRGDRFYAVTTNTPFYDDDDGSLVGVICVSCDSRPFLETRIPLSGVENAEPDSGLNGRRRSSISDKLGLDSKQPLQAALASKISNLVSLVLFVFVFYV